MSTHTAAPAFSVFDFDFLSVITLAENFGFEGPDAFIVALAMRSNGVDAGGAVKLFRDASRRVQQCASHPSPATFRASARCASR